MFFSAVFRCRSRHHRRTHAHTRFESFSAATNNNIEETLMTRSFSYFIPDGYIYNIIYEYDAQKTCLPSRLLLFFSGVWSTYITWYPFERLLTHSTYLEHTFIARFHTLPASSTGIRGTLCGHLKTLRNRVRICWCALQSLSDQLVIFRSFNCHSPSLPHAMFHAYLSFSMCWMPILDRHQVKYKMKHTWAQTEIYMI